jgi:hypothetical protein
MSIASSVALASGSSAAQSRSRRRAVRRFAGPCHAARRLISSTTKRCSRLRRLDECEQLAADRHAARNSGRQTRRAAEPDSDLDAIEQEQKVALVAARVRHAPHQRLVAQIGLRSVRERHDRSLEIGAAAASAWSHEHALKHRRVSSRLDQGPLVDQCAVGQQKLDDVDGAVENRCIERCVQRRHKCRADSQTKPAEDRSEPSQTRRLARAATQTSPDSARQRRAANDQRQMLSRSRRAPSTTASSRARAGESRAHALA